MGHFRGNRSSTLQVDKLQCAPITGRSILQQVDRRVTEQDDHAAGNNFLSLYLTSTYIHLNEYPCGSVSHFSVIRYSLTYQETLFGRAVSPAERLRQHQRALAKAQRELDRERSRLEQGEKKLVADIKRSAKAGQMVCNICASSQL